MYLKLNANQEDLLRSTCTLRATTALREAIFLAVSERAECTSFCARLRVAPSLRSLNFSMLESSLSLFSKNWLKLFIVILQG